MQISAAIAAFQATHSSVVDEFICGSAAEFQDGWLGSEVPSSELGSHSPQPPGDDDRLSQERGQGA